MKKSKKIIAVLCVILNIILLSQLIFGSVSGLYDAVMNGGETVDQHICDCGECEHELRAESVCTEEELANMRCPGHTHTWVNTGYPTGKCKTEGCGSTSLTSQKCSATDCGATRLICHVGHIQ